MVKKIGLIIVSLVLLIIVFNLIQRILDAFKSSDRLTREAEKVYQLEAANKQLKQRLSEVQSADFIETEARDKLNLSKTGETLVIIPEQKIKELLASSSAQIARLPNWLGWWRVFFK